MSWSSELRLLDFDLAVEDVGESVIVVDGSGAEVNAAGIGSAAAVASDGRVLAAWYEHPPLDQPSIAAEWTGLLLGLRLAAGRVAPVTILADNENVAVQGRLIAHGQPWNPRRTGVDDPELMDEMRALMQQEPRVTIGWRHGVGRYNRHYITGRDQLSRSAHAASWLIRRLAVDGIDPESDIGWIARVTATGPRRQTSLTEYYKRHRGLANHRARNSQSRKNRRLTDEPPWSASHDRRAVG